MKKQFIFGLLVLLTMTFFSSCGFERIDAGFEGIKVNKYGDEKGVDQVTMVTGAVWYNKIRQDVYEIPIFMQDYDYKNMSFKTADMMNTTISAGIQVSLPEGKTPALFVKYRSYFDKGTVDLRKLIYKHSRQAFSNAVGEYNAEELITKKELFAISAEEEVKRTLGGLGFVVDGVFLLADPSLPDAIQSQVDDKIKADQIAQKKESELRQTSADSAKRVVEAGGIAEAMKIQADAERYAYEQKKIALNSLLVQQQFIEKWDGALPTYGEVPTLFKNIATK